MDQFIIKGPTALKGTVEISGSKNASLPILMATLLTDDTCVLRRVPNLRDVRTTFKLLKELGKEVTYENGTATIKSNGPLHSSLPYELVKQMRASFWVAGPLLARLKHAQIPLPGGCAIGVRPVDIHLKGFEKMGAVCATEKGDILIKAAKLNPAKIVLRFPSVGATINLMMCASLVPGKTVIENAAQEPEVDDLINALKSMGADISINAKGSIVINGKDSISGMNHTVVADRIESGTYIIAAAATKGDVLVKNCVPTHNDILIENLREAGFDLTVGGDFVHVRPPKDGKIKPVGIRTMPYPGFATDLQAPYMTLLCLADGSSDITEDIFENRYMHAPELVRMGANITIEKTMAKIKGVEKFSGASVMASDLRGGMALILAALCADGESVVDRIYHVDRGYENVEAKLTHLGANIKRFNPRTQEENV
ncbi:UDP-N-acetylglucosamine 1-carboxyvinyltransferase [Elusimicrobium simillimum]|uniref:UDP-N-acetylglucosamine 1-carboxyvinyltransferase n=1 Tax=Elusimicrobium simillimum TaxID=3143438 RepID=UPI003C702C73